MEPDCPNRLMSVWHAGHPRSIFKLDNTVASRTTTAGGRRRTRERQETRTEGPMSRRKGRPVASRRDWSPVMAVCPGPGSSTGRHAAMPSPNPSKGKQRMGAVFCRKCSIEAQTAVRLFDCILNFPPVDFRSSVSSLTGAYHHYR